MKKQHSREESTSKKPKQVSQGSPKSKSPKQMDPPPSAPKQSHPDPKLLEQDFVPQLPTIVDPVTGTLMPLFSLPSLSLSERVCLCPSCFSCLHLSSFFPFVRQNWVSPFILQDNNNNKCQFTQRVEKTTTITIVIS